MSRRTTRRNGTVSSETPTVASHERIFPRAPSTPASHEDKQNWKGFCEIESEPAFFNVMLRKFGVRGVKVREIVSLDEAILSMLPRPVYGLIFLFKWTEEDPDKQEQSCPEEVWFANQTINNACASVALLNIVNNIPEVELGENLREFRGFTNSFSPALRGDAIANFEFVKEIHNSYARKMDMLSSDLMLKNEATAKSKGKSKKSRADEDENEAGFHFIAFMPIEDKLWKLDGLERQPMCLGPVEREWLDQAKPDIETRMAQYEEGQIEFAILSLVKDPLLVLVPELAANIRSIVALSAQLNEVKPDWQQFTLSSENQGGEDSLLTSADATFGLTPQDIDHAKSSDSEVAKVLSDDDATELLARRRVLVANQARLRTEIMEEQQLVLSDEARAAARSRDFGAKMQTFARKVKAKEVS